MPRVATLLPVPRLAAAAALVVAALAAASPAAGQRARRPATVPAAAVPAAAAPAVAARTADTATAAAAARLRQDIAHLASDRLEGRFTGSRGADSAAAYVARRFAALRLRPVVVTEDDAARCSGMRVSVRPAAVPHGPAASANVTGDFPTCASFLQRFAARSAALAHAGHVGDLAAVNVVGLVEGSDPALRGQVVVVGAHYDHLGRETMFASDPKAGAVIHNGADDNASGTAAVLELARRLKARPARRSVLFVAFSGEELGLLGSQYFVAHSPVPVDSMAAMLNFDMIGRLRGDSAIVYGVATAAELPGIVDSANAAGPRLTVRAVGDGFGPSDHSSFYAKDVPVLHFFTDLHPDYHAATDDVEHINAPGTARVVALAEGVLRRVADRPARLTFRRAPSTQRMAGGDPSGRPRPYLGSIPDMAGDDGVQGLRLQGVTPESPADKAGLKAGDLVVEIDGKAVTDLYSYTDALYARAPGDVITVVALRGGSGAPERVTVRVTLGRRGE
jgi:hypothetical protein